MLIVALVACSILFGSEPLPARSVSAIVDPALLRYASATGSVRYTENGGQWDNRAKFWAHGGSTDVWLTATGLVYGFHGPAKEIEDENAPGGKRREPSPVDNVTVDFVGASQNGAPVGIRRLRGIERFYTGRNPGRSAHAYGAAEIKDLYPGIDLVSYIDPQATRPRYDLIVHPNADPGQIRMRITGAKNIRVDAAGQLTYQTAYGEVSEQRQMAYQDGPTLKSGGQAPYRFFPRQVMNRDGTIGFDVAGYRPDRTLIIDPLVWSTFLGANGDNDVTAVKVGTDGSVYVSGFSDNADFFPGQTYSAGTHAFVGKFTSSGGLAFGVYYEGSGRDEATSLGLDSSGNVYVAGSTTSTDLPVTDGSTNPSGDAVDFIAKFDAMTGSLDYGKYLTFNPNGDFGLPTFAGIAVAPGGIAYIGGIATDSVDVDNDGASGTDFRDLFVLEISADGNSIPGQFDLASHPEITASGTDVVEAIPAGIAIDAVGDVFVCGYGDTTNVPLASGYQRQSRVNDSAGMKTNGFIVKLSGDLTAALAETYLGGTSQSRCTGIAVDSTGAPYVCGSDGGNGATPLPAFPLTAGAYDTTPEPGKRVGFVSRLAPDLSTLDASTFFASGGSVTPSHIALDPGNNPVLEGTVTGTLPITPNAFQSASGPVFVSQFSSDLTNLDYSTYFGDSTAVMSYVAIDANGVYYLVGDTGSATFPTTPGAFETTFPGGTSGFITVLKPTPQIVELTTSRGANPAMAGGVGVSFSATVNLPATFAGGSVTLTSADGGVNVQVAPSDGSQPAGASYTYSGVPAGAGTETFTITAPNDVASAASVGLTATTSDPETNSSATTMIVEPFVNPTNPLLGEYAGLIFGSASVKAGGHISGTVHVFEAPATDQVISITTPSGDVTLTGTVTVPAGKSYSNPVTFLAGPVDADEPVSVTATAPSGISAASASFTIDAPVFGSATYNPNPATAGDSAAYPAVTVQLSGPVKSQTLFSLTSGTPALASNVLITVPAGSSVGSGAATTSNFLASGETSVAYATTFTASGSPAFAGRLYLYPDVLKSIAFTASPVNAGSNAMATVTVTGSTVAAQTFNLSLNTSPPTTVPVTIPGGQSSTTISVPTPYAFGTSPRVYELSGTYNGGSAHADISVTPNSVIGMSLACTNSGSGIAFSELDQVQVNVTLAFAVPLTVTGGATIPITSSLSGIVGPFTVNVPAGQNTSSATFTPAFTNLAAPRTMTIYAVYGTKATEVVTINPEILSLTLQPSTIDGGQSTTATITLFDNAPPGSTVTATVHSSTATLAAGTNPIAITGNGLTYTFTVNAKPRPAPASPVPVTIQIVGLNYSRTATLTINHS